MTRSRPEVWTIVVYILWSRPKVGTICSVRESLGAGFIYRREWINLSNT
ncbi:hypothetical protein [Enterobacter phage 04_vB_Eclo_IJM]|nr:hypothetical protein [Enterobacter phage 04_vB_Eclo_IJM]